MCQVTVVGAIVILLYSSRACYNLVVLGLSNKRINSFDYDWYNVSDQVRRSMPRWNSGKCVWDILFISLSSPSLSILSFFQADLQMTLGDTGYIVFGVILFVWELLPTSLLVFFFRVRQPNLDRVSSLGPTYLDLFGFTEGESVLREHSPVLSKFPALAPQSTSGLPGHVFSSRSYFFDNPRRYDSDDDLAWSVMPQNIQAR